MEGRVGADFVDPHEAQRDIYKRQMEELERQVVFAATRGERSKLRCEMLFLTWSHRIGWRVAQW